MHAMYCALMVMTLTRLSGSEQNIFGNYTTIFDYGTDAVHSFYENCSLAANVRVFDTINFDFDWSTYMDGLDHDQVFTIVLATQRMEPLQRAGATLMMALCDFHLQNQHDLENFTFK